MSKRGIDVMLIHESLPSIEFWMHGTVVSE